MASKARDIADLGSNDVLETTSTGLDVTGTLSADGLTVDTGGTAVVLNHSATGPTLRFNNLDQTVADGQQLARIEFSTDDGGSTTDEAYLQLTATGGGGAADFDIMTGDGTPVRRARFGVGGDVSFYEDTGTTAKMVWDASAESLGIGTASPIETLTVVDSDFVHNGTIHLGSSLYYASIFQDAQVDGGVIYNSRAETGSTHGHKFHINGTERARIDSSGNLLVGKTSPNITTSGIELHSNDYIASTAVSQAAAYFTRQTTDGDIALFRKDGSTVGSIGSHGGAFLAVSSEGGAGYLSLGGTVAYAWSPTAFYPTPDNLRDLGLSNRRFDDIYLVNAPTVTSDGNEKQDIEVLNEAEQRVAQACKGLLRKFRWKHSVAEKGDDARIHFGIIAQDLQDAFTAEGLDAGRYAMFISTTWTDEETGEERTRLGVRYSELLAFIISAL